MGKMKRAEMDNLIMNSFKKTVDEHMFESLVGNIKMFSPILKEFGLDKNNCNIAVYCLACIQTAQENSINTIREVLYKLCCEDDETENTDEVSEMTAEE